MYELSWTKWSGELCGGNTNAFWTTCTIYLSTIKNFQASARSNDYNKMMRNIVHRMTDEEMKAVASYIEGLY